jgi:hypothetical protein
MMADHDIEIELLPRERELILEYGYPFPDAKTQLQAVASSRGVKILVISRFYLNQMIGDLCHSINKRTQGKIQNELLELCDRLESIERYGEGELEYWER